jgi:hypothetical protein
MFRSIRRLHGQSARPKAVLLITQRLSVPVARCGKTDPIQIEDQPKHKTFDFSISIKMMNQATNLNEFFAQKATEAVRNHNDIAIRGTTLRKIGARLSPNRAG